VMRQAMAGILPEAIRRRPGKADLHPSFVHGLRTFERELLARVIVRQPERLAPFVNTTNLRAMYERFLVGRATPAEINGMWRAVCLGAWLARTETGLLAAV